MSKNPTDDAFDGPDDRDELHDERFHDDFDALE